jgi:Tol biopolymer transport system component
VRRLAPFLLALIALAWSSGADAARREHAVHGTVRKLCDAVQVHKWPGGPRVGRVAAGRDLRRYHFEGAWALTVSTRAPVLRGYVLVRAFCPPSARGRRAAAVARRLAAHPPPGRAGTPLARPQLRRVCAPVVYLRDRPLNRPISLLYVGDAFGATRRARNPWIGGVAHGHAARRGWVPRSALCRGLGRRAAGHTPAAGPARSTVLAPPSVVRCGARVSGRRMLQVGVQGASDVAVELRGRSGAVVSSARFTHGRPGRWSYAAAGPYECGKSYVVAYEAAGVPVRFAVSVAAAGREAASAATAALPFAAAGAGRTAASAPSTAFRFAAAAASVAGAGRTAASAPAPGFRRAATVRSVAGARRTAASAAARALRRAAAAAASTHRALAAACRSRPQRRFAHGGRGPVDHRFHARPAVSADGRYVAYDLPAAGLVAGDRNHARDVFVRDVATGRTELVSIARGGGVGDATSRAAAISADGATVAFESSATNLVAGDDDGRRDVFVRDLRTATTRLVAPGRSPALSGDGRFVAFERAGDVVVADLRTAAIRRVARAAYRPALSADGRYVAYESRSATLARGDANHDWDVFRTELATGRTVLLSAGPEGRSRRGTSLAAVLSADGSVAAFQSDAPLVRGDRSGLRDVFVRDVAARRTVLVSANGCGRPANGYNRYPSISADGRRVAFDSHATDLVRGAPRGRGQVYLRDLATRRTRLLSATPAGRASSRTSFSPALAARAAIVAFPSFAYDLGPKDANRRVDIYLRGVATGRTQRLSLP